MEAELVEGIVNGLRQAGINFVTYLPETRLSQILPLMQNDPSFKLVPVSSEAEGISIAAGAALVGKQAACYMEGTGIFVSAYNLLLVGVRVGVPMLLLVSYVGSFGDQRNSFRFAPTGLSIESQLKTLGLQYEIIESGENLGTKIKDAARMAHALKLPVALLFTGDFTL